MFLPPVGHEVHVAALARDANGVPGIPPLTDAGKREVGWDAPGVRPGAPDGTVIFTAHTWPDGSALGNALLHGLHSGDRLVVVGRDQTQLCYRVDDRMRVPVSNTPQTVLNRVYSQTGPAQLVIIACSGKRLGPEDWTDRTLWFATPID